MNTNIAAARLSRAGLIALIAALSLVAAACSGRSSPAPGPALSPMGTEAADAKDNPEVPNVVIAPGVSGVDEALVRDAFRRVVAQGASDYGLRPTHTVTVYIDPDSAIGLEDALGLSQKYAIHLRAGHAHSLAGLLPLMMHEYTHALQYQLGRLRPQWWVEGQADFQSLRIQEPGAAERQRRSLYSQLAGDVRSGKAPALADLRSGINWDEFIRKSGAAKAYGWGSAAVAFIESRAGFSGVVRVMTDSDGPNTLSRFDGAVQEVTGLNPNDFDAALKQWVVGQAKG